MLAKFLRRLILRYMDTHVFLKFQSQTLNGPVSDEWMDGILESSRVDARMSFDAVLTPIAAMNTRLKALAEIFKL